MEKLPKIADMAECLRSEKQYVLPWKSHSPCRYSSAYKLHNTCSSDEPACSRRTKRCTELMNCGYGYPESFDGRVLNPYNTSTTGFIPEGCVPRDYINSKGPHYCDRKCGKEKRVCYYRFHVQTTEAHDPRFCSKKCKYDKNCPYERCIRTDGVRTVLAVYNNMMPGPTIAVCKGDKVVVDVVNHLNDFKKTYISDKAIEKNVKDDMKIYKVKDGEHRARRIVEDIFLRHMNRRFHLQQSSVRAVSAMSLNAAPIGDPVIVPDYTKPGEDTTCHFHGFFVADNPQADGPHFITQNGIPHGSVYRSSFIADTLGTELYHSHTGMQRSLGCIGRVTVRSCDDPHCKLFDYDKTEHSVMITDFGYNNSHNLDTLLMNSHACNRRKDAKNLGYVTSLKFNPNKRHRVRFTFNGITSTKLRCFIVGLRFLMTAVDGHPIKPVWIDSFVLANGERAEGVLKFNKGLENFFVHCYPMRNSSIHQLVVLHVKGAPKPPTCKDLLERPVLVPDPKGIEYNTENAVPGTNGTVTTSELHGLKNVHELCREKKVEQMFFDLTVSGRGMQINNITDEMPEEAYLCQYYRKGYIDESNLCDAEHFKKKGIDCGAPNATCRCNHIIKVKEKRCYEFVLCGPHPFHLHGHAFYVVAQGKSLDNTAMTFEKFRQYDLQGLVRRNLENPPQKDTVTIPAAGYTVIRLATTNPGFWKAHCHIELHGISGMSFTLWVQSKNENIMKRMGDHVCEPFKNNVCTGKYIEMHKPKKYYW